MNNYVVAKASVFRKKADENSPAEVVKDKNGAEAIILSPVAGNIPWKRVMAGTVAQQQQIFDGGVYLLSYAENAPDPVNGRQFSYENLGELKGFDLIKTAKEVGAPFIIEEDGGKNNPDPNIP